MKATGIVRRIDDLGRIVIPKEIRRTLRIREGDPLEIFTDREGEIILQKYSPIGELSEFAKHYAESLAQNTGHIICITDRDQIIAVAGGKKELLSKSVHKDLEDTMEARENILAAKDTPKFKQITNDDTFSYESISPIICEGDVIGSVCILTKEQGIDLKDTELKLAATAATFLGKQLEQ